MAARWAAERARLEQALLAGMTRGLAPEAWRALTAQIMTYQAQAHPLYGRYCRHGGVEPGGDPWGLPPLPVEAFKRADLFPHDASEAVATFFSSGTTAEQRSRHVFKTLALMDTAILATFAPMVLGDGAELSWWVLTPSDADAPHSSLVHMFAHLMRHHGGGHFLVDAAGNLDAPRLTAALDAAEASGRPVFLLGPSFAFVHFLDGLGGRRWRLPAGSRLLETGGYKGLSRQVPRPDLHAALVATLGLEAALIVAEYGMSELSSQLYEASMALALAGHGDLALALRDRFVGPPWCRFAVLDPDSLTELPWGEEGQIALRDLANLDSAAYVLTGDLGRCHPVPPEAAAHLPWPVDACLQLCGRAGAVAKGCSIALDAMLSGAERSLWM